MPDAATAFDPIPPAAPAKVRRSAKNAMKFEECHNR